MIKKISLQTGKKIYFASDFHLGFPNQKESLVREHKVISWLEMVRKDAQHIFLMGDVFDFWFEYSSVIPKGFVRLQGKIAEITDSGIPITFFAGNHDMWVDDYFEKELGMQTFKKPETFACQNKLFHIGHGDGLGDGDGGYKFMKKWLFKNRLFHWLFKNILHPNIGMYLAHFWSKSRQGKGHYFDENDFKSAEKEWIWTYCNQIEQKNHHDYYIFGHRHLPLDLKVGKTARYINLGEWMHHCTYAVFDGQDLEKKKYEGGRLNR